MKQDSQTPVGRFEDLDLSEKLVKVLTKLNFTTPTPIQGKAIPVALTGRDVIGIAQTGTGKTLSFFLPMLQNIAKTKGTGLIIVPTRELAFQVREEIDKVGRSINLRSTTLIGGANINQQIKQLKKRPHVIVATPGRLIDHIERRSVDLTRVHVLVLDEADRMLDMGFAPQIKRILETVPDDRQTLLFSATMPEAISRIAHSYMKDPARVEVAPAGTSAKNIEQGMYFVEKTNRFNLLLDLLREHKDGPVLVFCRTKHGTKKMAHVLKREGFKAGELHSNRSLAQRRRALERFKKGDIRVMVATDVAARGIDVKEIELVVNYDLPDSNEDYVHRIGRTGRAGHKGRAVSFALPDQYRDVKAIERLVDREIPVLEAHGTLTQEEVERIAARMPASRGRNRTRSGGGGRGRGRGPARRRSGGGRPDSRRPGGNRGGRRRRS